MIWFWSSQHLTDYDHHIDDIDIDIDDIDIDIDDIDIDSYDIDIDSDDLHIDIDNIYIDIGCMNITHLPDGRAPTGLKYLEIELKVNICCWSFLLIMIDLRFGCL